jgi:uncharacterized protein YcnI
MNGSPRAFRLALVLAAAAAFVLLAAASASAHAEISPKVSLAKELQLYSLAVPTEKEGKTTTQIVLAVPKGFSIDSFVPSPGWKRTEQSTGSGENAVIQKVTWTGGKVPTEEDALFQFLASATKAGTYTFQVEQTYSDGSLVDWSGSESSDTPAPTIAAKNSIGGGGTSTFTIIALVVGALGVVLGVVALVSRGGRQVA